MEEKTKILLNGKENKSELINLLTKVDVSCSTRELNSELIVKIKHFNKCIEENIEFRNKFNVNERFEFLEDLTNMIIDGKGNSLIVIGEGGLGKTFTVLSTLSKRTKTGFLNLFKKKEDVHIVKGFSTARGLYDTLYDNRDKLILFDDCDSILEDKTAINILKSALDSYDTRIVTWSKFLKNKNNYPQSFEFTGRIIFISNKKKTQIPQPILTRGYVVDLEMSNGEKIDRMAHIMPTLIEDKGKGRWSLNDGFTALEFIRINIDDVKELSIRTLVDVLRIMKSRKNWEKLALYTITE